MGFYGSVYYQLINTFYKVIVKNSGLDTKDFLENVNKNDLLTLEASGRKGVINLANGNKWINFSKDADDTIKIWHSAPDDETAQDFFGMKLFMPSEEDFDEDGVYIGDKEYRQLNDHDFIQTYETKKDAAGHLHGTTEVIYRLPKAEVNEKVDRLEELIGDSANRELPEFEEEENQNLYGYVEENFKDINTLEKYVGDWKKSTTYWNWGDKYAPTIVDAIGNLDDMYDSYLTRADNHQTFSKIIGNLPNLWEKFNDKNPISLSSIILKHKEETDTFENTTDSAIGVLNNTVTNIGSRPDGYDTLYTEVVKLHNRIDSTDEVHEKDKTEMESAYKDADSVVVSEIKKITDALETRVTNTENAINTINNDTILNINTTIGSNTQEIGVINGKITEIENNLNNLTEINNILNEIKQNINEIKTVINTIHADNPPFVLEEEEENE